MNLLYIKDDEDMSMYNIIFGGDKELNNLVFTLLKLDSDKIERFRDCGFDFKNKRIWIYTRTGGNNRKQYKNEELTNNKYYITDYDDDYDCTYAMYEFKLPYINDEQARIVALHNRERPNWKRAIAGLGGE